jgi:uncharacterized Zn-binding protein involved in type VI secretion
VPAATRAPGNGKSGDNDLFHCSTPQRNQGSPDVFVNNQPWSRQGDNNNSHLLPGAPCPSHVAPITIGSTTVFVNTKGAGRIGDAITGCTSVAAGSPNVFAGP